MVVIERRFPGRCLALALSAICLSACAMQDAAGLTSVSSGAAQVASAGAGESPDESGRFQRDRQSILSMAGDYRVTFDFIETVSFRDDYVLAPQKISGGREVVRVIEDRGDFISLQHILVASHGGETFPIKHWRQDWQYEPERVLVFAGANTWEWRDVPDAERQGKWSQTVFQVDDTPRYGAVAAWQYEFGVPSWSPPHEWRPLPRRDMTTRDDYHAINAVNRHVITPSGWVHEQDNDKIILATGQPELLVREIGVNAYVRDSDFDVSVATDYWAATEAFWAGIREEWAAIASERDRFGLTIQGETEALYVPLLELADEVAEGRIAPEDADTKGRAILRSFVAKEIAPLAQRVAQTPKLGRES